MEPRFSLAPVVRVNGQDLGAVPGVTLVNLRVERGLRIIGRATLRLVDPGLQVSAGALFALGNEIAISLRSDQGVEGGLIFSGLVTTANLDFGGASAPVLVVTADDSAVKLTRDTKTTTFTQMTLGEIVSELAREAGLQVNATNPVDEQFKYLIRSGTALQFIDDIAQRYGVDWYMGGTDLKTLTFAAAAPSTTRMTLEVGVTLSSLTVRTSGLGPTQVATNGWDVTTKAAIGPSTSLVSTAPSGAPAAMSSFRGGNGLGDGAYVTSVSGPTSGSDAQSMANALAERAASASLVARGETAYVAQIEPGDLIEIAGAGPANGVYRLSRVEHVLTGTGFITRFSAGDPSRGSLVDSLGPRRRDSFSHSGLLSGVVTNNSDPEGLGRVQVMFGGIQTSDTSAWARIATPGAGAERGLVMLPELGDEVLVGFEQGDILRPVVLGGLYNGNAKMASYGLAASAGNSGGQVAQRTLKSRKGYRMQIDDGDAPADDGVTMALTNGTDHMVRLGKDRMQIALPAGIPLEITVGSSGIEIDGQGNVTIRGNKVTIASDTDVSIAAKGGKTEMTASAGQVALSGMTFAIKATATGEINGGGSLTAKAAAVMIN